MAFFKRSDFGFQSGYNSITIGPVTIENHFTNSMYPKET
jgi:hypothetical protein